MTVSTSSSLEVVLVRVESGGDVVSKWITVRKVLLLWLGVEKPGSAVAASCAVSVASFVAFFVVFDLFIFPFFVFCY